MGWQLRPARCRENGASNPVAAPTPVRSSVAFAPQGTRPLSPILDIHVSPDAYEPFPHSYRKLLSWALLPAPDDVLDMLVDKGRRDATAWAASMQLLDEGK